MNEARRAVILNVDDNDGARYAKSRVLRLAGFEVLDAADGAVL
jgi:CheY-like chemotaxis protein